MNRNIVRILDQFLLRISLNPLDHLATKMQMSRKERKYIADALRNKANFLEIGSGYSTLWFSQFVGHIVSIESRTEWFEKIQALIKDYKITTIQLFYFPPESSAFNEQGLEKWTNRNTPEGSDYGTIEEFSGYSQGIEELVSNNDFEVILVDGQIREEIIQMLQRKKITGKILLHDVETKREHLNKNILTMEGVKIINKVDTLVELLVNDDGF